MQSSTHIQLRRAIFALALAWFIAGGGMCSAGNGAIDPQAGIPVFLKIITYDENFAPSPAKTVRLLIIYDKNVALSYTQYLSVEEFLNANRNLLVGGRDVRSHPVELSNLDSVLNRVSPSEYTIVLVTSIGKNKVHVLAGEIQEHGIRSFTFDPDYVPLGLAVGVRAESRQPVITVNLDSSRKEGSRYSAHLLKICEVYKD